MSSLLRTNIKIIKHIPKVIIHNYLPVKIDTFIPIKKLNKNKDIFKKDPYNIKSKKFDDLSFIYKKELDDIFPSYYNNETIAHLESSGLQKHKELLDIAIDDESIKNKELIKSEIMKNSYF